MNKAQNKHILSEGGGGGGSVFNITLLPLLSKFNNIFYIHIYMNHTTMEGLVTNKIRVNDHTDTRIMTYLWG